MLILKRVLGQRVPILMTGEQSRFEETKNHSLQSTLCCYRPTQVDSPKYLSGRIENRLTEYRLLDLFRLGELTST